MKKLSICIPNYKRKDCLEKLVRTIAMNIVTEERQDQIEICVNDDCSPHDPIMVIKNIQEKYPQVCIKYNRNEANMGMDYNFLKSVQIASGEYCWIIGNDDMITKEAFNILFSFWENYSTDFIVTPFDVHDYNGGYIRSIYPLKNVCTCRIFDTNDKDEFNRLLGGVNHNSGVFGFLSNVVFKRVRWIEHGNMFEDKMNSIFIQVYMNLQTLNEGASYAYLNKKIIDEYSDIDFSDITEKNTCERVYKIVRGLNEALDYFFCGELRKGLQERVVDKCIDAFFWELPKEDVYRRYIENMDSKRVRLLDKHYLSLDEQWKEFKDKHVIVYGAGVYGARVVERYRQQGIDVVAVCDQDVKKQGNLLNGVEICSFEECKRIYFGNSNVIFAVANMYSANEIVELLQENDINRFFVVI